MTNHFMGMDGFVWFTGVVEDRDDPDQLGRVRVRILGYHTEDKIKIPTADLPWAHVMHPVTDPSMNGMGHTPSFMVEGTWVLGFFRDAEDKQQPIIIGTLPGVPELLGNPNKGFSDPNRRSDDPEKDSYNQSVYPRSVGESDVNRLARGVDKETTIIGEKDNTRTIGIPAADDTYWDEPKSTYNASYPKNHVFESEAGHIVEFDDTPKFQRLHEYSSSGTFYEIDAEGNRHARTLGNNKEIVKGDEFKFVQKDMFLTVSGTLNIKCDKLNIEVSDDYKQEVNGDKNVLIKGTSTTDITGAVKEDYGNTYNQSIIGKTVKKFGDTLTNFHLVTNQSTPTVTNHHEADVFNFITGEVEFHTSTNFEIFSDATFNVDAKTSVLMDSALVNINSGGSTDLAARKGDTADTGDDPAGISAGDGSNVIETGSATVLIGSSAPTTTDATAPDTDDIEIETVDEPDIADIEPKAAVAGGGEDEPTDETTGAPLTPTTEGGPMSGAGSTLSPDSGGLNNAIISAPGDCTRKDLGSISEQYESNGNAGAIGKDRVGGFSYGSYQIAAKVGTMRKFLTFLQTKENGYTDFYTGLEAAGGNDGAKAGSDSFKNKWKEYATSTQEGDRFKQAQHDFIQRTHHDIAVKKFKEATGIDICDGTHSNGIQDAFWSTAVQHGPGTSVFKRALERTGKTATTVTDAELIEAIYDERGKLRSDGNLHYFRNSTSGVQTSVKNRFLSEKSLALANNTNTLFNVSSTIV